jgi:anaerobic selenocysteine-containing dehydrogenase
VRAITTGYQIFFDGLASMPTTKPEDRTILQLRTLRSNSQFNTTIYSYDDRFHGIFGSRHVVMMHRNDIDQLG